MNMTYVEFKEKFLPELRNIRSFAGRIRLADQQLQRIGSGTGRAVYDIDGEKVLKLAKNTKGIAQNKVESNTGYYRDTQHIVAEIFDSAEDDTWLISEHGKKVTKKRIEELTGIPSLEKLYYFLRNFKSQNNGRGKDFTQEKEVEEFFWENEFAQDLQNFIANYAQSVGDMGRPSSYGEVLRDGQPAIVLTDYGLNDEVYDTHYSGKNKKERYQMYELFNYADGNDDILSDTGDQGDIRRGMWAQVPYTVDDGHGVVNEEFIDFVSKQKKYPQHKSISRLPELTDHFHDCKNNLKEVLNLVEDKKQFYTNLLSLQEYLIRRGFFGGEKLGLSEDGSSKFSTSDAVGQDSFPTYDNTADTSPCINNSLDANIAMYEDLIYKHVVGDATDDKYMLSEVVESLESLKPLLAQAAQVVYDEWEQNDEGECDMYGAGGICQDIAEAMCNILNNNGFECVTVSQQSGEQHVYPIVKNNEGIWIVDIPPYIYETGGGYCWKKISNVKFNQNSIVIDYLSDDPNDEEYDGYFSGEFMNEDKNIENINEVVEGGEFQAYHGSDKQIDKFVDDFVGTDEATDQEGPGIYFSTSLDDVKMYGNFIHTVILRPRKLVDETSFENINKNEILNLLKTAPDWEDTAQNWAEDPNEGVMNAVDAMMQYSENEKDLFQQVWFDFYRHNPVEYVRAMVNLGYDGQIIEKSDGVKHIIVYNPNIIEQTGTEELSEEVIPYSEDGDNFDDNDYDYDEIYNQIQEIVKNSDINILSDKQLTGFVLKDNNAVGAIFSSLDNNEKEFSFDVVVDEKYRGTGIGRELTQDGIDQYESYRDMFEGDELKLILDVVNPNMRELLKKYFNFNDVQRIGTDRYMMSMNEVRKKGYMPGSKTVKVKRKCQLGGKADGTSDACNQGDDNNLEFGSVNDGIGDKYAEKKFGIEPEFDDFEKKYDKKKSIEQNQVVYNREFVIIKNPENLNNFGDNIRGVIDTEGNLYIEQRSTVIHQDIIEQLRELGLLKMSYMYSIGEILPSEYITVQRFNKTNKILIGESNHQMRLYNRLYDKAVPVFQKFMDAAKHKNPKIDFVNQYYNDYSSNQEHDNVELSEYFSSLAPMNEQGIMRIQDLPFRAEVEQLGGQIYAVGGAVRDEVIGKDSKDLDIVIRGIPEDKLAEILNKYGTVNPVGESFAVTKFVPNGGTDDIDIAVPRTERSTGEGHKDFEIVSDYTLPIEKDLERRDFTINAIAKDMEGNVIDPFNGMADLKSGKIRITYPDSFRDDALRMLRAVGFASRFDFDIDPKTYEQIKKNAPAIKTITKERIQEEFQKIVDKGDAYKGAFLLKDTGLLRALGVDGPLLISKVWDNVTTLAEFVYLLSHNIVNPISFYVNNMRGDTKIIAELKGLIVGMEAENYDKPIMNRSTAHNMILASNGLKALESKLLPQSLQVAAQELLQGKYPKTVKDLAVNGNDLMDNGLHGKEIGATLKSLLMKVYTDNVRNDREELLSLVKDSNGAVEENHVQYSKKSPDVWDVNGESVEIDFFVDKYDKWVKEIATTKGYINDPNRESVLEFIQDKFENFSSDEKLLKYLYWNLIDRELLNEDVERTEKVEYGALMLYLDIPNWKKISSVIEKEDIYEVDGEFGVETEPHVTILYGFHKNVNANDVFDLYKEHNESKPIKFKINGISIFENDEFDVVKIDVESKVLTKLNKLMRELPSTLTFPKYHAHITLAYVKKGMGKKYVKKFNKKLDISGNKLVFSTKKEKKKNLKLNKKGFLKEEEEVEKVRYTAVVLDDDSRASLIKVFHQMIPEDFELVAHHMTINMGEINEVYQDLLGIDVKLTVISYAIDDKVMAVGVKGCPTVNEIPHITVAVNRKAGGKPYLSNKLTNWKPINFPINLNGKVEEVK